MATVPALIQDFPSLSLQEDSTFDRLIQTVDIHDVRHTYAQKAVQLLQEPGQPLQVNDVELEARRIADATNQMFLSNPISPYSCLQRTIASYQAAYLAASEEGVKQKLKDSLVKLQKVADICFTLLNPSPKDNVLTHTEEQLVGYRLPNFVTKPVSLDEKRALIDRINSEQLPLGKILEVHDPLDIVCFLKDCGEQLTYLYSNDYGTNDTLAQILACTPNLQKFIAVPFFFMQFIDQTILPTLSRLCPKLTSISLESLDLTRESIEALSECKDLRSVTLKTCSVDDSSLEPLLSSCSLKEIRIPTPQATVTSKTAHLIATKQPQAEVVELNQTQVDDEGIQAMVANLKSLRMLLITGCTKVTDAWTDTLSQNLGITDLELTGTSMSEAGVNRLVMRCPELRTIMVRDLAVTDNFVNTLMASASAITKISVHGTQISENALIQLVTKYKDTLEEAHLATKCMTEEGLFRLGQISRPPKLQKISLPARFENTTLANLLMQAWPKIKIEWRKTGEERQPLLLFR